jgi:hypothetical protein
MKALNKTGALLALTVCTLAAQSALACKSPMAPRSMPDGRTSQMQTMLESKKQVEDYTQKVSDYMSCETNALKLQEAKAQQTDVLNRFNAEVRAFKIANSPMVASRH